MTCHQKTIKDQTEAEDRGRWPELFDRPIKDFVICDCRFSPEIRAFVERYEWMGTVGVSPRWCFAARIDGVLAGVVCMNLPNAFSKMFGPETKQLECLIQRGASASFGHKHLGSKLIMWAVRWMVANTSRRVFYGYSDPRAGERGIIYSACNFLHMGDKFGATTLYRSIEWGGGKEFSPQSLRRTPVLKRWMRENNVPWLPEYAKPNGFKDLSRLPVEVKNAWYRWGDQVVGRAEAIPIPKKRKWVMILGRDRKETKRLRLLLPRKFGG